VTTGLVRLPHDRFTYSTCSLSLTLARSPSAALAIYAQARRFGEAHGPFAEISARRAKSYLLAINALALVDPKHAWLAMPVAVDPSGKVPS
jgi:hypothetical protein